MSQPDSIPRPRRRRPLRRWLLGVGLLLLAVVAAALLLRQEIARRAAVAYLEAEGVAVRGLEVTRLTPGSVEISGLALGANSEITAERIVAVPARDGLKVSVKEITVEGLRLKVDVTGDAPLLGSLQPLLERLTAEDESDATAAAKEPAEPAEPAEPLAIPPLHLIDAQVIVATPSGPMTADLGGRLSPAADGGLNAAAELTLDSALGRLRARLDGSRGAEGALALTAELADGRLAWEGFSVTAFSGQLSFDQAPQESPRVAATLALGGLSYAPPEGAALELDSGRLNLEGGLDDATLSVVLDGGREYLSLTAEARSSRDSARRDLALTLQAEARTAGGLARFLALPGPEVTAGTLVLQASGEGSLPADQRRPDALLPLSALKLKGDAILGDVVLADGTKDISAHLPLIAETAGDQLTVTLSDDAEVRVEQPARASLQSLGIPDDVLPLIASGLSLTLTAGGDLPFRLATSPVWPPRDAEVAVVVQGRSDQGLRISAGIAGEARLDSDLSLAAFSGQIDSRAAAPRVTLGGRESQEVELGLPLTAAYGAEGLQLTLSRAGRLNIRQFGKGAPLRLGAPLTFTISALALQAAPDASGYSYTLTAAEDGATMTIAAAAAKPLALSAGSLALQLDGRFAEDSGHDADLTIDLAGFDLPGYAFATEAAAVAVKLDRELGPQSSSFRLGPFQLGGDAPLAAPLLLTGKLARKGKGYDIAAALALAGGPALADVTARYSDDGTARLEAVSRALVFSPDGLQPAQISPLLAALEEVRGSATGKASFAWPQDPAAEAGRFTLNNLSFSGPADVSGLDLDLTLERLLPLASAPNQRLTIRSLEAGLPVDAIEIQFSLDQAPQPQLKIRNGSFGLGGARWYIAPTLLAPAAARNTIELGTEALDLATFFKLIEVDGLSGSGTLKGRLPIAFEGDDIVVDGGRFEALGPGKLSFRFEALRSALAGGGKTVELAVKALEDFNYENLSLTLAKTAENDATLRLSTLGQNPEVLDGQPFQFNINLESNLTSVLDALKQGYSLSDDALRRAWQLKR
ncbi:MAG: YdbH domain-containing protein [Kiloniellaceae bacterium]